jgi:1-pyrroline-5-carboxylate dehydrogenase
MLQLPAFRNEPYLDFTNPENRQAMQKAMDKVRGELGREYHLLISGERVKTGNLLRSVNPSKPGELVGSHHKATPELARRAVEDAYAYFAEWAASDPQERVQMLVRAARRSGEDVA